MVINISGRSLTHMVTAVEGHSDSLSLMAVENEYGKKFMLENIVSGNVLPDIVHETHVDIISNVGAYGIERYLSRR